jgi:hypothetical protein
VSKFVYFINTDDLKTSHTVTVMPNSPLCFLRVNRKDVSVRVLNVLPCESFVFRVHGVFVFV